jgi:hypothetical protein
MSLIPTLGRQRYADLYEFESSLVYTVSSSQGYMESPCLKTKQTKNWGGGGGGGRRGTPEKPLGT